MAKIVVEQITVNITLSGTDKKATYLDQCISDMLDQAVMNARKVAENAKRQKQTDEASKKGTAPDKKPERVATKPQSPDSNYPWETL